MEQRLAELKSEARSKFDELSKEKLELENRHAEVTRQLNVYSGKYAAYQEVEKELENGRAEVTTS
jgi:hypothetical protein